MCTPCCRGCCIKRSGQRSTAQPVINQKLVEAAQQYRRVVRLKGGDPMLFGRADEEMRALEANSIPYEIVPGITAAPATTATAKASVPDYDPTVLPQTKSGLDEALKMPSFQLNVRNQSPNKLLLFLVTTQLMTNIGLIAILWHKLG